MTECGAEQLHLGPARLSASLAISPPALEERYWNKRCRIRLSSLDITYEMCNLVLWLSILASLHDSERVLGKARSILTAAQLAVMYMAPHLWVRRRTAILTTSQLLQCALMLLSQLPTAGSSTTADSSKYCSTQPYSTAMMVASNLWTPLLFVMFHQQPVSVQAPLLAATTFIKGAYILSSPLQQSGLQPLTQTLTWGFEHLVTGLTGSISPAVQASDSTGPPQASVLTTVLFLHVFGGFLLPLYVAYIMEWKLKVSFLLSESDSQLDWLRVLTPAAAILRGSTVLSSLLYAGSLLLMAIVSWVICSTVATMIAAPLGIVLV